MKMKNEDDDNEYIPPFIKELIYLTENEKFKYHINLIRLKWGIVKEVNFKKPPIIKVGDYRAKTIIEHEDKVEEIIAVVDRCRLGKGKYRTALTEAILYYAIFNEILAPSALIIANKKALPKFSFQLSDQTDIHEIIISIGIYPFTTLTEIRSELKKNSSKIKQLQKSFISKRGVLRNRFMDHYKLYLKYKFGHKSKELYKSKIGSSYGAIDSISHVVGRFNREIASSFI